MYRLAKKYWFYDFGAYRKANHEVQTKQRALETSLGQRMELAETARV
jgi:hypothetical protein